MLNSKNDTLKNAFLKPCPFCGGEAYIKRINYGHNSGGTDIDSLDYAQNLLTAIDALQKAVKEYEGN